MDEVTLSELQKFAEDYRRLTTLAEEKAEARNLLCMGKHHSPTYILHEIDSDSLTFEHYCWDETLWYTVTFEDLLMPDDEWEQKKQEEARQAEEVKAQEAAQKQADKEAKERAELARLQEKYT